MTERSRIINEHEHSFSKLLEEEGLKPEEFLEPLSEYDEVPLCTRLDRLAFLGGVDRERRSIILMAFALEYMDRVLELAVGLPKNRLSEFFLMLTIVDWEAYSQGGLAMPCFWTTTRASDELRAMRIAVPPYSAEARNVERWLTRLDCNAEYVVADYPVPPDDYSLMRVHVGRVSLPRGEMPSIQGLLAAPLQEIE